MNRKNRVISSSVLVFLIAIAVYLGGCASAETNAGKIAFQKGDYEKAAEELRKGMATNSTDAEGWYMLGYSLMETGKYQEGAEAFQKSLSINNSFHPNIWDYYVKKYNDGVNRYNSASKMYATDSAGAMNTFNELATLYTALSTVYPDSIGAQQMKADTYLVIGRKDEALAIYETIITKSKSPQDAIQIAKILTNAGITDYNAGDYDQAIVKFDKVITLPYLPKSDTYYLTAKLQKAYANYKMAEELSQTEGLSDRVKTYLNSAVDEADDLTTLTTDNGILKDTYQLLVTSYGALEMDAERDAAQAKLDALGQ